MLSVIRGEPTGVPAALPEGSNQWALQSGVHAIISHRALSDMTNLLRGE